MKALSSPSIHCESCCWDHLLTIFCSLLLNTFQFFVFLKICRQKYLLYTQMRKSYITHCTSKTASYSLLNTTNAFKSMVMTKFGKLIQPLTIHRHHLTTTYHRDYIQATFPHVSPTPLHLRPSHWGWGYVIPGRTSHPLASHWRCREGYTYRTVKQTFNLE